MDRLPPYQFLIAFSQLISRICHPNSQVFNHLEVSVTFINIKCCKLSMFKLGYYFEVGGALCTAVIVDDDCS